jgi:hypothetical protein
MPGTTGGQGGGPIRGTQSFVGVMTAIWRRPSLTALEIFWRWAVGAPIIALAVWRGLLASRTVTVNIAALQAMTVFQPVAAFHTIDVAMAAILPAAKPIAIWLLPLAAIAWVLAAAFGRTLVLRRLDRTLHARPLTLLALGVLRAVLLTIAWMLWLGLIVEAGRIAITGPAGHGGEPNIVLYSAILICGTLVLYVLWAIVSWPFQLAPLIAMQRNIGPLGALDAAFGSPAVRSKLIEVNLVMNIVKLAVLVLAMVLSASPMAFSSAETQISQTFLNCWWLGAITLYMLALDYFHVVHTAAQLSLWRAYDFSG